VRTLRRVLIFDVAAGLLAWLLTINFYHSTGPQILERLIRSMASAFFIATPTVLVVPRFSTRMLRRRFPINWILLVLSILGCAAGGSLAYNVTALVFGFERPGEFRNLFATHVQISAILALSLGIGMSAYQMLRTESTAARLASLESHVRPHFLFNALNTISSLIPEDPKLAEALVGKLASLLRLTLDSGEARVAPLEREIRIVSDYLEIEHARYGDRLRFQIDVPEHLRSAEVPALSIQTLVENSVKHAVGSRFEGAEIRVKAFERGGSVIVEVSDDGPGLTAQAIRPGHGLDNLQRRLTALFGSAARLEITNDGGFAAVSFRLPRS
jgi:signal transduction histidine kinase